MAKIVPTHPHLVTEYQDTILASVNDQDISIRMRALDLLSAMVLNLAYSCTITLKSIVGKSQQFAKHCSTASSPFGSRPLVRTTDCLPVFISKCFINIHSNLQSDFTQSIASLPSYLGPAHLVSMLLFDFRKCHQFRVVSVCSGGFGPRCPR